MSRFRPVTPRFAVSPQISAADVAIAADERFALIINNRPDGEAPDQPTGAEIEAAALAQSLSYVHIPVVGRPTRDQARAMREAVNGHDGRALAYCRSGARSILTWALGELVSCAMTREEIVRAASMAGYDLEAALPR